MKSFAQPKVILNNRWQMAALFSAVVFSGLTLFVTLLHYQQKLTLNATLWVFWLLSITAILLAYLPSLSHIKNYWHYSNTKEQYFIFIFTSLFYFLIRVAAYKTSPLNDYGLFDDAAWDIIHAKKWVLLDNGYFQPHFIDVGTSRESLFHYFVIALFKLCGYNLFVFNMALFFLGYVAVLFTTLTIHFLFNRWWITTLGAAIMLVFPLHVTQTFLGHRYAIAMPLIMISYYYLAYGFKNQSPFQVCVGSLFVGLSLLAAPMGKQYLMALLLTIPLAVVFCSDRTALLKRNFPLLCVALTVLIICLVPLFCYAHFNWDMFINREKGVLEAEWVQDYRAHGLMAIPPRLAKLGAIFFSPISEHRLFMWNYPIIPYAYWLLLVPGMIMTITQKRWEILIMSLLPAFIGFLTVPYDFRVQISTPFWIITMLYAVNGIANHMQLKRNIISWLLGVWALLSISVGFASSVRFTHATYSLPPSHSIYYYLDVRDIAFVRLIQDIARGNEHNPSIDLKKDELNPTVNLTDIHHDLFVCPGTAYGTAHLYLQNLNGTQALSFCQGINTRVLETPANILSENLKALSGYKERQKNIILIWELLDNTKPVIDLFKRFETYGEVKTYEHRVYLSDKPIIVYTIKIKKEHVSKFLDEVKSLKL